MKKVFLRISTVLVFLLFTFQLFAGWVIFEKNHDSQSKNKFRYKYYIQDQKLKLEEEEFTSIFSLSDSMVTIMCTENNVYWQGTVSEYNNAVDEALREVILKDVSGRSRVEQDMLQATYDYYYANIEHDTISGVTLIPNARVVNMGQKKKIAGVKCSKYGLYVDKSLKEEIWGTTEIILDNEIDIEGMDAMLEGMGLDLPGVLSRLTDPHYTHIREKGIMLRTDVYELGTIFTTEVYKIKEKELEDETFAVPEDYREVKISELGIL